VYANRGTAGIDGCTSAAIGHALAQPERLHVLLTGETAFLYDGNAFWQEQLPENLRIVVINNRGGGIFAKIKGPSQQPEQERFFQVPHAQDCFNLAARFGLGYLGANDLTELENHLPIWLATSDVPVVLEVHTSPEKDAEIWEEFKRELKNE
jgi:2-succinyl-5-enolpyruvyl-6-hydroxy-3-cyclohexene-1-carboxylate synthase